MKFALNGALTIGTLDGANVEIRKQVGAENFFLFGLTAPEVQELKARGYRPRDYYDANPQLKETLDLIASGFFSPGNPDLFRPLVDHLLQHDTYLLLADCAAYVECQEQVSQAYRDQEDWARKSILNVARVGYFSSDRSIREYCEKIWRAQPVHDLLRAVRSSYCGTESRSHRFGFGSGRAPETEAPRYHCRSNRKRRLRRLRRRTPKARARSRHARIHISVLDGQIVCRTGGNWDLHRSNTQGRGRILMVHLAGRDSSSALSEAPSALSFT